MPISDDVKKEHAKVKDMSLKGKWGYFWEYYRYQTLAVILIVIFAVAFIRDVVSSKDYGFCAIYFNALSISDTDKMMADFAEYAGIDTEKYQAYIDDSFSYGISDLSETTIASSQKFAAMVQVGDVDVAVADEDVFYSYALNELFIDLREVLPEDLLEKYSDRFFYIDMADIEAAETDDSYWEYDDDNEYYEDLEVETAERNYTDPSQMSEPVPVGIYVGDTYQMQLSQCYSLSGKEPVFGIVANTSRSELAVAYLRYLDLTEEELQEAINASAAQ